jgi:hypothetical protein
VGRSSIELPLHARTARPHGSRSKPNRRAPQPTKPSAKQFVDLSLACLKKAIVAGYHNFAHMKQDTDSALSRPPKAAVCPI